MSTAQEKMNEEIDLLIAGLQLAKRVDGFRTKVSAVDRVMNQVEGFVAYWDLKLDELDQDAIGENND